MSINSIMRLSELGVATVYEASGRQGLIDVPLIQLIPESRAAGPARTVLCGQDDNLMTARYYRRKGAGRAGLVIVLPIWGGHRYPPDIVAWDLAGRGTLGVLHVLGERAVLDWAAMAEARNPGAFADVMRRMVQRARVTVIDLRRVLDWAESRPEIDSRRIGIIGFSESNLQVAGLLASDDRVAAAVLVMGGAHPHAILATCYGPPEEVRRAVMRRFGWSLEQFTRTVEPLVVNVTGAPSVVDNLRSLALERLDITGASRNQTATRQVQRPPNTFLDRTTATVRVEIKAIECGVSGTGSGPCGSSVIYVAPAFENVPQGLAVEGGPYIAAVRYSGQLASLPQLKPADVRVTVSLTGSAGEVTLNVSDDGVGFDPGGPRKDVSLGLIGMRERIRLVNGRLVVESAVGRGTRIEARVPLPGII